MDEQTQAQFIQWLASKLGVQSEEELQQAVEQMGEEGIQQAMQQFMQENQGGSVGAYLNGGKLDYIKSLYAFKKGGSIKNGKKDAMTAKGVTKFNTSKDAMSAKKAGNRKEPAKKWITAKN